MPFKEAVPVRNRKYVRGKLLATFLRVIENGEVDSREINELDEVVRGTVQFADAGAAVFLAGQANDRAEDPRHFGDLIAMRNLMLAQLPDSRDAA